MLVYYLPAFCAALGLFGALRQDRRLDSATASLIAIILGLLAGLRWNADVDYEPYAEMFADVPSLADWTLEEMRQLYGEPGYLILNSLIKTLGGPFILVSSLCAAVSIFLKRYFFGQFCQFAALSLSLFFCVHFLTIEFIQIRWAVASSFLLLSFYFMHSGRNLAALASFLVAVGFHYFSVVFLPIALLTRLAGHRRFYLVLLGCMALGSLALSIDLIPFLGRLESDSDAYVINRTLRYLTDPASGLGAISFMKLLAYPAAYAILALYSDHARPSRGSLEDFLFKLGLASISATLLLSFIPIFHFRASVIADAVGLCLVLNKLAHLDNRPLRAAGLVGMTLAYVTWYLVDLDNQISAEFVLEYRSWLTD